MMSALKFLHAMVMLPILVILFVIFCVPEWCKRLWKGADAKKPHADAKKPHKDYWRKNRVRSKESHEIAALVHRQINHERQIRGLRWLYYDHHLAFIARGHSKDMAHYNYLGHVNRRGENLSARARRKGYTLDGGGIGENCCQLWAHEVTKSGKKHRKSATTLATEAVRVWMNSPGHRANILHSRYRAVGIGSAYAKQGGKVYVTQNFYMV